MVYGFGVPEFVVIRKPRNEEPEIQQHGTENPLFVRFTRES